MTGKMSVLKRTVGSETAEYRDDLTNLAFWNHFDSIIIGIVYCFYRYPIFGRPKTKFEVASVITIPTNSKVSPILDGIFVHSILRRGGIPLCSALPPNVS